VKIDELDPKPVRGMVFDHPRIELPSWASAREGFTITHVDPKTETIYFRHPFLSARGKIRFASWSNNHDTIKILKTPEARTPTLRLTDAECVALFEKAEEAGLAAGLSVGVSPMVVQERKNPLDDFSEVAKEWVVADGACGFAWVSVPANTSFGRWLKKTDRAYRNYGGGLAIHVHFYNQSLTRKEAHAHAFAEVLREAGIERAYAQSRMD
jgi:hypothetical protein